jgi:hypothetical protein
MQAVAAHVDHIAARRIFAFVNLGGNKLKNYTRKQ